MLDGLDLFTGIGGLSIALSEWVRPCAYCEIDSYCQSQLLSKISIGLMEAAPIWDDIRTFPASNFRGTTQIIYGGFPCQDLSVAGLKKGLEGERSGLFFEIMRLAKEIQPDFIFLENVPGILTTGGIRVTEEVTEMGYDCRWHVISAEEIGSPQKRERWFLLANNHSKSIIETYSQSISESEKARAWLRFARQDRGKISETYWNENESPICGMADGVQFGMDRIRALGNSVVSIQAREAFKILMGIQ